MHGLEELARCRARPRAKAADGDDLSRFGEIHDDRRHTGNIDLIGLYDALDKAGGDACIDRVAAGLKYGESGMRGEIVTATTT